MATVGSGGEGGGKASSGGGRAEAGGDDGEREPEEESIGCGGIGRVRGVLRAASNFISIEL